LTGQTEAPVVQGQRDVTRGIGTDQPGGTTDPDASSQTLGRSLTPNLSRLETLRHSLSKRSSLELNSRGNLKGPLRDSEEQTPPASLGSPPAAGRILPGSSVRLRSGNRNLPLDSPLGSSSTFSLPRDFGNRARVNADSALSLPRGPTSSPERSLTHKRTGAGDLQGSPDLRRDAGKIGRRGRN
jgi:hypothetical protein